MDLEMATSWEPLSQNAPSQELGVEFAPLLLLVPLETLLCCDCLAVLDIPVEL